jgi:hypothetical protein
MSRIQIYDEMMQTPINASRDAMYVFAQYLSKPHSLTTSRLLRNQRKPPLLRLPAELPNRIYGLILGGQEIRAVASKRAGRTQTFTIKLRPIASQDINTTEDENVEMSDDTTVITSAVPDDYTLGV